ncbi:MAG: hypothetical protein J7K15_13165, partial [Deltaproteobacteria bacterium]|nr:hypothetical protein [Deltaproteobacteria bacterium]
MKIKRQIFNCRSRAPYFYPTGEGGLKFRLHSIRISSCSGMRLLKVLSYCFLLRIFECQGTEAGGAM